LPQVGLAHDGAGLFPDTLQRGKQNRHQQDYNRNDDKQLDQGETMPIDE
jgi:hypothetical protein